MNLTEHRIPAEVFSELSSGAGGATAVGRLAAGQHSKHIILVRGVMDAARTAGHPQASETRRAYDLLATIQSHDPDAVEEVLRHPSVGAWARHTIQALRAGRADAAPGQLAGLAAAAAIRSRITCEVDVPVLEGVITLPSLGQATVLPGAVTATVQCSPDGAEVTGDGFLVLIPSDPRKPAPGWHGLRSLFAETDGVPLRVVIDDVDPYRMPGLNNLGGRLTSSEADRWQTALDHAWDLLVRHHGTMADEIAAAITVLTPLVAPPAGQSSSSSRETFGCVALSSPADGPSFAVTLAHETQHAKLSALLDLVPLTEPDDGSRYYAPWREDPRPAAGLLQGSYAYLGVTDFWRRQRHQEEGADAVRASAEFARWREAARMVAGTLAGSGRLTPPGETFVEGMTRSLDAWAAEPVVGEAAALARDAAERHRTRWQQRNGRVASL